MKLYCPEDDGHLVKVGFKPSAGERFCPDHGCALRAAAPKRRGSGRSESEAERRARMSFNRAVCEWPCFFQRHREGHHCTFPLDAHHLIPKQFIRQRLEVPDEAELLAVLYHPLIGAPLCRAAHEAVERGGDRIYWEELSEECIRFVAGLPEFMTLRLEEECPKREVAA